MTFSRRTFNGGGMTRLLADSHVAHVVWDYNTHSWRGYIRSVTTNSAVAVMYGPNKDGVVAALEATITLLGLEPR